MKLVVRHMMGEEKLTLTQAVQLFATFGDEWGPDSVYALLEQFYDLPTIITVGYTESRRRIAGIIVTSEYEDHIDISDVMVVPRYRKKGVGLQLMQEMLAFYYPGTTFELTVRVDNEPAIKLYKKLGFEIIARYSHYYSPTEDAFRMRYHTNETQSQDNN